MQTIISRDLLKISIKDDGRLYITNNGAIIEIATDTISSVEKLIASKSQSNIRLAEAVMARGKTHLLGGKVSLSAAEAETIEGAIASHPSNIAIAAKIEAQISDMVDYYKTSDNISNGFSRNK